MVSSKALLNYSVGLYIRHMLSL